MPHKIDILIIQTIFLYDDASKFNIDICKTSCSKRINIYDYESFTYIYSM